MVSSFALYGGLLEADFSEKWDIFLITKNTLIKIVGVQSRSKWWDDNRFTIRIFFNLHTLGYSKLQNSHPARRVIGVTNRQK
jgi:hypothetical protein